MKKFILLLATVVFTASILLLGIGCKEEAAVEEEVKEVTEEAATVAIIWVSLTTPYGSAHTDAFKEAAGPLNLELVIFDSNFDAELQSTQIDDAIALGVDLIAVVPVDSVAILPALKKAYDAGVPVMTMNAGYNEDIKKYIVGYSGVGYYEQGVATVELLGKSINDEGNIVIIEGSTGFEACLEYQRALEDYIAQPNVNINILGSQPTDWSVAKGTEVMEDFLTRFEGEIDAAFPHDDYIATGAKVAMEEAGLKAGDIQMVGIGGVSEALELIKEGWMYGTVLQSPIFEGKWAAERAREYIDTGELNPFYGVLENPQITIENVDDYESEF